MADSSSSEDDTPLGRTFGTSVKELQEFIRSNCSHFASGAALEALEAAAVTTMIRLKSIIAFRCCCFISKEPFGRLYDLVKQLAPPPPTGDQLNHHPLMEFKNKHPDLPLPSELDFLLTDYGTRAPCQQVVKLGLTDDEATEVAEALATKRIPEWLMTPCPFLTFDENLDRRVQIVRLWIASSKLPIYVGSAIDFEELRKMKDPPEEPADFALEENLPSKFQTRIREETVSCLFYKETLGFTLIHAGPEELPDTCPAYYKCYGKLLYPFRIDQKGYPFYGRITGNPEYDRHEFEDCMEADLEDFFYGETPRMYKRLAALLFSREVTG